MTHSTSDVAFTPTVKALQAKHGSRASYQRMEQKGGWRATVTDELAEFLSERDSFYLGTANAEGQPYIQHRGGPKGFLKVVDATTLGFADFAGNKQYISAGNLGDNDRAHIFLMDYANRRRIKIWGRAEVVEDDPELLARFSEPGYRARPERAFLFHISAWDVNCPQHITRRYTEPEIASAVAKLKARVTDLEAELGALKARSAAVSDS